MNVRKLLELGQTAQDKHHAEQELTKLGNLRGGSTGCIGTDGKIYGECHRIAHSRMLGLDKENDKDRSIMFDAGNATEDSWAAKLDSACISYLREEQIPVKWEIGNTGRYATGRPDFILGEFDGVRAVRGEDPFTPKFGLELKGIYSVSSALRVHVEGVPDSKHLAQAGFYSMALGVDYAICYTNPSVWDTPYWAIKKLGCEKKIQPFYRIFYLRWTDVLEYKDEHKEEWTRTVYTKEGIDDFYKLVLEMELEKTMGPRPLGGYADGKELPYYRCDYCSFSNICNNHENDYDQWVKEVTNKSKETK